MIQRIQSIYLLVVTILLLLASFLTLGSFTVQEVLYEFTALGLYEVSSGELLQSTWALLLLLIVSALLAFGSIFLYKKRVLQMRVCGYNMLIQLGFYLLYGWYIYRVYSLSGSQVEGLIGVGAALPAISMILSYLAIRAIGKDEFLVRALNRLR